MFYVTLLGIFAVALDVYTTQLGISMGYAEIRLYGGSILELVSIIGVALLMLLLGKRLGFPKIGLILALGLSALPLHAAISNWRLIA